MGISGRDLAILSARAGVGRAGAIRAGFCPDDVEGVGNDEPGEYVWKEQKLGTTAWTLQGQCEGNVCGWRPVAAFTYTVEAVYDPGLPDGEFSVVVTFTDASTPANDIETRAWDFGDGTSSTSQTPTHTFSSTGGPYTVTLTVTSPKGTSSTTKTIPAPGYIIGTITYVDYGGGGISVAWGGVTVTLEDTVGTALDTAITDSSGVYWLSVTTAGDYVVSVHSQIPPVGAPGQSADSPVLVVASGAGTLGDIDCDVV